jgi:hypothetical protein
MRRHIIVREEERQELILERLALALIKAAREAKKQPVEPAPEPGARRDPA